MNPVIAMELKESVIKILDELPSERIAEVLDFAEFVKHRDRDANRTSRLIIRSAPISQIEELAGIVSWGGDALEDSESLYDGKD